VLKEYMIAADTDAAQMGRRSYAVSLDADNLVLRFASEQDQQLFRKVVENVKHLRPKSVFSQRTEESSASQYFQFYGYLSQQQNMMQDYVRTSTYQRAILGNAVDFQDKIVLDVGAGSGILSFFAVQAGAAKVYAIEASNMAQYAQQLVESNNVQHKISVIPGKIEEIELPEKVDVIISEPMGYMLYNERMLETYLHARKWLKPQGKMYPTHGDLHIAPFSDESLYANVSNICTAVGKHLHNNKRDTVTCLRCTIQCRVNKKRPFFICIFAFCVLGVATAATDSHPGVSKLSVHSVAAQVDLALHQHSLRLLLIGGCSAPGQQAVGSSHLCLLLILERLRIHLLLILLLHLL